MRQPSTDPGWLTGHPTSHNPGLTFDNFSMIHGEYLAQTSQESEARRDALLSAIRSKRTALADEEREGANAFLDAMSSLANLYHEIYAFKSDQSQAYFKAATTLLNSVFDCTDQPLPTPQDQKEAWGTLYRNRIPQLQKSQYQNDALHLMLILLTSGAMGALAGICLSTGNSFAMGIGVIQILIGLVLLKFTISNHRSYSKTSEIAALRGVRDTLRAFRPKIFETKAHADASGKTTAEPSGVGSIVAFFSGLVDKTSQLVKGKQAPVNQGYQAVVNKII